MILKMFSKLDSILCLERKRESKKSSFLIRDILDEGEDEEVVVADEEDFHVHPPGPTLLSLPQGALWDAQVVPYPHPDDLLAPRAHRATGFSLCCLNCPPQSWHTGFPADLLSPQASAAGAGGSPSAHQPGWTAGVAAEGKAAESGAGKAGARKVRRNRTVFTELQLMGLERRFDCQKYLSTPDRAELARALGLTQLQVKTWYQNRRMKWKKQVMQGGCTVPPTKPKGRPKKNSIPSLNETRAANELAALKEAF